jgi:hypothetical protein
VSNPSVNHMFDGDVRELPGDNIRVGLARPQRPFAMLS